MLVRPREYTSAAEIIDNVKAVRQRFRMLPAWQKPEQPPPPPKSPAPLPAVVQATHPEVVWKPAPAAKIRELVARKYGLTRGEIAGQSRRKLYIRPRHIAMYLCVHYAGLSFPQTGRFFGDRDHTTVLHAIHNIARDLKTDQALAGDIAEFIRQIEEWS